MCLHATTTPGARLTLTLAAGPWRMDQQAQQQQQQQQLISPQQTPPLAGSSLDDNRQPRGGVEMAAEAAELRRLFVAR
jgi:hypothetical protein